MNQINKQSKTNLSHFISNHFHNSVKSKIKKTSKAQNSNPYADQRKQNHVHFLKKVYVWQDKVSLAKHYILYCQNLLAGLLAKGIVKIRFSGIFFLFFITFQCTEIGIPQQKSLGPEKSTFLLSLYISMT